MCRRALLYQVWDREDEEDYNEWLTEELTTSRREQDENEVHEFTSYILNSRACNCIIVTYIMLLVHVMLYCMKKSYL